jgi:hypothetical protein
LPFLKLKNYNQTSCYIFDVPDDILSRSSNKLYWTKKTSTAWRHIMYKKLSLLITFLLVFIFAGTALAQGPGPTHTDPAWQVSYWNNKSLSGTPVVQTSEGDLNWDWGQGAPANVPADGFSARWTKYIDSTAGSYRFTATADDGIRVYVDNTLLINQWSDHPAQTFTSRCSFRQVSCIRKASGSSRCNSIRARAGISRSESPGVAESAPARDVAGGVRSSNTGPSPSPAPTA